MKEVTPAVQIMVTFSDGTRQTWIMSNQSAWDRFYSQVDWRSEVKKVRITSTTKKAKTHKINSYGDLKYMYGPCGDGCGFAGV